MSDSAFTVGARVDVRNDDRTGVLGLPGNAVGVRGHRLGERTPGAQRAGMSTVLSGAGIFAVSAMKCTPQKTIASTR